VAADSMVVADSTVVAATVVDMVVADTDSSVSSLIRSRSGKLSLRPEGSG
jgi:hypothetical protein